MNYFENVGLNIQSYLDQRAMKKTELAKELNTSKQVVQKIVSGQKAINVREISKIAEILETTVENLLVEHNNPLRAVSDVQFMGSPKTEKDFNFIEKTIREYMKLEERFIESNE